jgi:hypothetical protein
MSSTSHTFTSLPLVHTLNPDFLRRHLWLCFLLVRESSRSGNLRAPWLPNLTFSRFPNFTDSRISWLCRFMASSLYEFATPKLRRFKIPDHRVLATPRLRRFKIPDIARSRLRDFAGSRFQAIVRSRLWDFAGSGLQIVASSLLLKTYFTNFINLDVSRVTGFPEFPNRIEEIPPRTPLTLEHRKPQNRAP